MASKHPGRADAGAQGSARAHKRSPRCIDELLFSPIDRAGAKERERRKKANLSISRGSKMTLNDEKSGGDSLATTHSLSSIR